MTPLQVIYYTLGAAALFGFLSFIVLILTWAERKALARIQMRMGPMRVGFHGTLQPIADGIKLFTKEDILTHPGQTEGCTGWRRWPFLFRRCFYGSRCLWPATSFYEIWTSVSSISPQYRCCLSWAS